MATDRPALDRAARVAYEAAMEGAPHPTPWECLPAHMHKQWERVAQRLLGEFPRRAVCRGIPNGPGDGYMSVPGEDYGVSHCEGCAAEAGK